jgi:putative ABC transport system substrate-binding protein
MNRRKMIAALGGAAAWPLAAHAQQGERMRRIGVLSGLAVDDHNNRVRLEAFQQRLQQLGWTEGHDLRIDYRDLRLAIPKTIANMPRNCSP